MNHNRRNSPESIRELKQLTTTGKRERKHIQKTKITKIQSKIASLSDDLKQKRKASEDLAEHIKSNPDSTIEDSFNHLLSKKHRVFAVAHAIDRHYGRYDNDDSDNKREHQQEQQKERLKRDIDAHVLRSANIVCPVKLRERIKEAISHDEFNKIRKLASPENVKKRINELDRFYNNDNRTNMDGMNNEEAEATSNYVDFGTKIRPKKPQQSDRIKIIKAKIAKTRFAIRQNNVVERILSENYEKINQPEPSSLIDEDGNILRHKSGFNHYEQTRQNASQLGIKLDTHHIGNAEYAGDEHVHQFLQKTNTIRLQSFPFNDKISLHITRRLTPAQIKTVKDISMGNKEVGYFVGPKYETAQFGEGLPDLLRAHSRVFSQMNASQEGEENMTYQKSKKIKLLKELFGTQKNAGVEQGINHPNFDIAKDRFEQHHELSHKEGFSYIPSLDRSFNANIPADAQELHRIFGNGKDPLHVIAVTDNRGTKVTENLRPFYEKIKAENMRPVFGGWEDKDGSVTDVGFIKPMSDDDALVHLRKHNQKASYRVDINGNSREFKNPFYVDK